MEIVSIQQQVWPVEEQWENEETEHLLCDCTCISVGTTVAIEYSTAGQEGKEEDEEYAAWVVVVPGKNLSKKRQAYVTS